MKSEKVSRRITLEENDFLKILRKSNLDLLSLVLFLDYVCYLSDSFDRPDYKQLVVPRIRLLIDNFLSLHSY